MSSSPSGQAASATEVDAVPGATTDRPSSTVRPNLVRRWWIAGQGLVRQLAKFGTVGIVALTVDVGLFNLLSYVGADPLLDGRPLMAKVLSTTAATAVAWLGNRYWTFRRTRRADVRREAVLYFLMCTIGLFLALSCLWISHYLFGFTSPLADNIAANVVGLALGTTFRFWAYQRFVFTGTAAPTAAGR